MGKMTKKRKISIGLPILNGEKFIKKKIESLLTQNTVDCEIIISDNKSTDLTAKICKEYSLKDDRIQFFEQPKRILAIENFAFVLDKAKNEFFVWTAVDDFFQPGYLKKSIDILENNKNIVCSGCKLKLFGETTSKNEIERNDSFLKKILKKNLEKFGHMNMYPASGLYETRIREYIKNFRHNQIFYGVYRTEQIRQAFVKSDFYGQDGCTIFNLLKFGELNVLDENLMSVYDGGISRKGMIGLTKSLKYDKFNTIFPSYQFTKWCEKNLGSKIFLKNLGFFIKINFISEMSLLVDISRKILRIC